MKLRTKVIALYSVSTLLITAALGGFLYHRLWADRLDLIRQDIARQLQHIDFTLEVFLDGLENDLDYLVANPAVASREDGFFTSFLTADETSFRYRIAPLEQQIIDIFSSYRKTHPYVNAVYMGRENGSFVRSHKRTRPTRYDPRDRPWYKLARANPGRIVITDAYPSLTAPDVNIGIVKALVDRSGKFYGAVGIDVTLAKLTDFIASIKTGSTGSILMTDTRGIILVSTDRSLLYQELKGVLPEVSRLLQQDRNGEAFLEIAGRGMFVNYHASALQNWKIAALIPRKQITDQIRRAVLLTTAGLALSFFLLTIFTLAGLNLLIVGPLHQLSDETRYIAETSHLGRRIAIHSRDEIGLLAASFNEMIGALEQTHDSLEKTGAELRAHRNRLEEMVQERTSRLQETNEALALEISARIKREAELSSTLKELAIAKQQAEEADRLKSAFLATMSHELRTPLNSIIGFTGIILRERVGPLNAEQKKQLGMVQGSSRHLLALINDVLDISKIEAGQLQLAVDQINMVKIIERVLQTTRPLAATKGIELVAEFAPSAGEISGDQRRVEQILLNLLSNAIKFTERGSVRIVCAEEEAGVAVSVIDTGIGIKQEDMEMLFQSFRQIDSGLTRKYEGTGLGLSISKRLVELMGGRIWVESIWGKGSTFTFILPKGRKSA